MSIFFITGTSGSGKTTLTKNLKRKLPKTLFAVHDFDENGVPVNADEAWRRDTTDKWLVKAKKNDELGKSTVICGVSVPSEVVSSSENFDIPLYFGFLKIDDKIIKQRLQARHWDEQLIQDNIYWAHYLEPQIRKQRNNLIVDSLDMTQEQIANKFVNWILSEVIEI